MCWENRKNYQNPGNNKNNVIQISLSNKHKYINAANKRTMSGNGTLVRQTKHKWHFVVVAWVVLWFYRRRASEFKRRRALPKKRKALLHCSASVVGANGMQNIMAVDSGDGSGKCVHLTAARRHRLHRYIHIYFDNLMDFQL